jgi:hypothetical protein
MMNKTLKTSLTAAIGLLIMAGPVSFQRDCSMDGCCCVPDAAVDLAFNSDTCCGCGVMEQASIPVQPVELLSVTHHENIRPEADIDSAAPITFAGNFDLSYRNIESELLSPPSIKIRINIPLIC